LNSNLKVTHKMNDLIGLLLCSMLIVVSILALQAANRRVRYFRLYTQADPVRLIVNAVGDVSCEGLHFHNMKLQQIDWDRVLDESNPFMIQPGMELTAKWVSCQTLMAVSVIRNHSIPMVLSLEEF
jgi:hypothetical protein